MSRPSKTGTTPGGKGRYDGYDVLSQVDYWDETTAAAVLPRVEASQRAADAGGRGGVGEGLRFFGDLEAATARALLDLLMAQFEEPRIPLLPVVDQRLADGETDGWRYDDMPEDGEAWRRSLAALDDDAKELHGQPFHKCSHDQQGAIVQGIADGDRWHDLSAPHVWSLWTRYACSAFYAHPWSWNEIGFGGPAYPRGYKVLHQGWLEPWERPERDAEDPIPWAERTDAAKQQHEERTSGDSSSQTRSSQEGS